MLCISMRMSGVASTTLIFGWHRSRVTTGRNAHTCGNCDVLALSCTPIFVWSAESVACALSALSVLYIGQSLLLSLFSWHLGP